MSKEIIGRTVLVDLPKFGFAGIPAKIDTGAYYCSLHCHLISEKVENNRRVLCFNLLDPSHPEYQGKTICYKRKFYKKLIKNSFGDTEERYIIRTPIRIHKHKIKASICLTNRGSMKYPMLIGRKLIKNKFLVDVSVKL